MRTRTRTRTRGRGRGRADADEDARTPRAPTAAGGDRADAGADEDARTPRAPTAAGGDRAEAGATRTGLQGRKGRRCGRGRAPATCPLALAERELFPPLRVVVAADLSRVPPGTWRRLQTLLRASYSCSVERRRARAWGQPAWELTVQGLVAAQALEVALAELCEARCTRPEDVRASPWPVARGARPHFQGWRLVHPVVTARQAVTATLATAAPAARQAVTAEPGSPSSSGSSSEVVLWRARP